MLTTDDEPDIFTLGTGKWNDSKAAGDDEEEVEEKEPTFIGHWNASTKMLTTVAVENDGDGTETSEGETLDWSSSCLVGSPEQNGGVVSLD